MEWRIYPQDVLFFRGTAAMNLGESSAVTSMFPPSPEVMQGFVRTTVLETMGVPFEDYAAQTTREAREVAEVLGAPGADLGRLRLRGPYLLKESQGELERWYPMPLDLMEGDDGWRAAELDPALKCDLTQVSFIEAGGAKQKARGEAASEGRWELDEAAAGRWISKRGLEAYLAGRHVSKTDVKPSSEFWGMERRVGIGRDAATHAAGEHLIYAPAFVRLRDDINGGGRVGLAWRVQGVPLDVESRCGGLRRMGGEGRLVNVEVGPEEKPPQCGATGASGRLLLLSPARWNGAWLPPDGQKKDGGWLITLNGTPLTVISAVVDKPVYIGGWDIVKRESKPAEACVPAGSVYFVAADSQAGLAKLHDSTCGERMQAGFGHLVIGSWKGDKP